MEQVPNVTNVRGGPSTDGESVVMILSLADGGTTTFGIPLVSIPSVIAYLLNEAKRASEMCSIDALETWSIKPFDELAVGVSRLSVGPSSEEESAFLELDIGHIALRFKLPVATLVALSHRVLNMVRRSDT